MLNRGDIQTVVIVMALLFIPCQAQGQDAKLEQALQIRPKQSNVDFDMPSETEIKDCQLNKSENPAGGILWVITDGEQRVLRKFEDQNADSKLDRWSYFKNGIEVYRDLDSNGDRKADQSRWLATAGMRWGIDRNQDGVLDYWKSISAEEVSQEVVEAILSKDPARFNRLLISQEEVSQLGLGPQQSKEILERIKTAQAEFPKFVEQQRVLSPQSTWIHFSGTRPGTIPAGTDGSRNDITIYDSVAAVVESGRQHVQLSIGTLIKVNDAWRLVDLPEPIVEGRVVRNGALFFNASASLPAGADTSSSSLAQNQKLFEEYENVDRALRNASPQDLPKLHAKRAEVMTRMIKAATTPEDRSNWIRQMADMVSGAYQEGQYDDGIKFLQNYIKQTMKSDRSTKADDLAYAEYRLITSFFSKKINESPANRMEEIQKQFMDKLEDYVKVHPRAIHAADAMLQLGFSAEFASDYPKAKEWYRRIANDFANTSSGKKAAGAAIRLESEGRRIQFTGKTVNGQNFDLSSLSGKVVLIQYWATWCEPCKNDLPTIAKAHQKFGPQGFEVVSVSLDNVARDLQQYLGQNRLPWIHLFEEGGLDSPLAEQLGIALVPTMILVGADGKVVNRNISASDLDRELTRLFQK